MGIIMSNYYEDYFAIRKDLSGARTQNRFKFQKHWGVYKLYELYKNKEDFIMVFDYACDIDVLINNQCDFYQVKTLSDKRFSVNKLMKKDKITGKSVISKLAEFESRPSTNTINIVANTPLIEANTEDQNLECFCLSELDPSNKAKLIDHIKQQLGYNMNIERYYYIKSDLSLGSSYQTLIGHTVELLDTITKTGSARVKFFLDLLLSIVEQKTTYEHDTQNIQQLLKNKALDKSEFTELLKKYDRHGNRFIEDVYDTIKKHYTVYEISQLNVSLSTLNMEGLFHDRISIAIESINEFLKSKEEDLKKLEEKELIEFIYKEIDLDSSFDDMEKKCIVIFGVVKFKGGYVI